MINMCVHVTKLYFHYDYMLFLEIYDYMDNDFVEMRSLRLEPSSVISGQASGRSFVKVIRLILYKYGPGVMEVR